MSAAKLPGEDRSHHEHFSSAVTTKLNHCAALPKVERRLAGISTKSRLLGPRLLERRRKTEDGAELDSRVRKASIGPHRSHDRYGPRPSPPYAASTRARRPSEERRTIPAPEQLARRRRPRDERGSSHDCRCVLERRCRLKPGSHGAPGFCRCSRASTPPACHTSRLGKLRRASRQPPQFRRHSERRNGCQKAGIGEELCSRAGSSLLQYCHCEYRERPRRAPSDARGGGNDSFHPKALARLSSRAPAKCGYRR